MTENDGSAVGAQPDTADAARKESGYYEPYSQFARALRLWFLAYGVGAPVVVLTHDKPMEALAARGCGTTVAVLFLAGVAIQIVATILYKSAMWILYSAELKPSEEATRSFWWASWISEAYWLEFAFDLVTFTLFGVATVLVVAALT